MTLAVERDVKQQINKAILFLIQFMRQKKVCGRQITVLNKYVQI